MDWFPLIVTAIGIPSMGALFVIVWAMNGKFDARFTKAREERITQIAETRAEARAQIAETKAEAKAFTNDNRRASDTQLIALRDNFQAFQLKVAEEFVPNRAFREFRVEVMSLLEKMDGKIDKIADRA